MIEQVTQHPAPDGSSHFSAEYPLTPVQAGMLFHRLSAPGSGTNVEQVVCRLHEPFDAARFVSAFNAALARHPVLRARFVFQDRPEPRQQEAAEVALSAQMFDFSRLAPDEQERRFAELLESDRLRDFELAQPPLMRLGLVRLGEAEHALLWTFHHILLDRHSLYVVLAEVFDDYDGLDVASDARRPFCEFVAALGACDKAAARAYYQGLLSDFCARTPLEVGFAVREGPELSLRSVEARLSAADTRAFVARAEQLGVAPSTLFEAAWALLIMRYSDRSDVVFGSARAGREGAFRDTLGLLIDTVPLRARATRGISLAAFVRALEEQKRAQPSEQALSLTELQQTSALPSGAPLFDSLCSFEPHSLDAQFKQRGARFASRQFAYLWQTALPLTWVGQLDRELFMRLGFDPARYDRATAERLLAHALRMIETISSAPLERELAAIDVLSRAERAQLIDGFNQTDGPFPDQLCMHALFEAQVARAPDAPAVCCRDQQLRYGELDQRANQLARWLEAQAVGPGVKVGICLPRSLELVVAMLAVLKAGGAYVPLDPAYPQERLRFMLEDSGAGIVLTSQALCARLPEGAAQLFCLDREQAALAAQSSARPVCRARADDVAYILYTSGSTGQPKGVVVRHRSALNLIDWVNTTFAIGPEDRLLFVTSVCFDLSVYDVFGVLGAGGSLHVASSEELREPRALVELLRGGGITLWDSAPAALMQLVPFLPQRDPHSRLRLVLLSGDWIPVPLPDQVRAAFPMAHVISLGGATEATIWSNYYVIGAVSPRWPSIPYGRPIRNARYYVLSEALAPLPIGVPGQLHIGGACLADGYHNRAELTAERFVPNPFAPGKLYRTGDLARFMPDGNLEFLGRMDQQVKVRGFRIELGEIEAVLNRHPQVASSLVDAPRLGGGERSLVAYLVARGAEPELGALRALCAEHLPEYMVPAHFVLLPALPVTPNGKLDRRALPAPNARASAAFSAPRNALETAVAELLASSLGVPRVGVHDDFFELGGHSLLAVRVIGELRRVFDYELALASFLAEPTVAAIAERLAQRPTASARLDDAILPAPEAAPVVSLEQTRLAFVQGLHPHSAIYNICLGFQLRGAVDPGLLERALNAVVARHEPLRTAFRLAQDGYAASILEQANVELERADLSALPEPERKAALASAMRALSGVAFNLAKAPLLRARLIALEPGAYALLIVVHHVVFDGPSSAILLRELVAAYDALARGEPVRFARLPVRFNDVARWQLSRLERHDYSRDLAYWRARLAGPLPVLQLPHDRPRPRVFSYRGAVHGFRLSPADSAALRRVAQAQRSSVFTSLLAAFSALLHRYSGQSDVLVAIPVAAREQPETRDLIGLLLNTLVIRSEFSPSLPFAALLAQVRARFLEALEHRELPFERLVADLNPPRDPSITPVFQAFFSYEETSGRVRQSDHFAVSSLVVEQVFAGTELSLFVEDSAEHGISGYFEYSSDLFEPATVARVSEGFVALLRQVSAAPEIEVDRLRVMSEREREEQLFRYNQTRADFDLQKSVVALFEARARQQPEQIAVYGDLGELRYGELCAEVRRLAARLSARGAGPGRGVAVFLERSPHLLLSLLAVLRTGAHYIPLDPSHPEERNARILKVAEPALILCERATSELVPEGHPGALFDLDRERLDESAPEAPIAAQPDGIAYIIFTSGSTGDPKGVEVPHRALTNFLCSMAERPGMGAQDTLLALTTISFDIAGLELYLPLVTGGRVDLAGRMVALDPKALAERLRRHGATLLQATPATFRMLLEDGWEGSPGLKVLCGGEAFPPDLARALLARVGSVWNMYGPTETTIWSSLDRLRADDPVISIGHPIHNTQLYVLNEALEPVPRGCAGMLYIGGDGVALGYHRRPDLTAAAFLKDPFLSAEAARIYRTGDLARRLPDGRLECLGRSDFQVKIRGYRIELGEIEAALSSFREVLQAAAHVRTSPTGDKQLVGYVVLLDRGSAVPDGLSEHLQAKLPGYMLPNALMALPALPLTPNGKVDRKALPEPIVERARHSWSGQPHDDVEVELLNIFARALGRSSLAVDDNFFEAGGHSLLAVRTIREVNAAFALDLSIGALFERPTVSGLATLVRQGGGSLEASVLTLHRGQGWPPLYFICGIQLYQTLARRLGDKQPSFGVFVPAEEEFLQSHADRAGMSIEQIATEYVRAVRQHAPRGPYALAGVSFGGVLAFEVARQLRAAGESITLLVLLDAVLPQAVARSGRKWLSHQWAQLTEHGPGELVQKLRRKLTRKLFSPPPQGEQSRDALLWQVLNGLAAQNYFAARPSYDGPSLLVRATDRPELVGFDVAPDLGWGGSLTGPLEIADAPGTHLGILTQRDTARLIRRRLKAAALAEPHASARSSAPPGEGRSSAPPGPARRTSIPPPPRVPNLGGAPPPAPAADPNAPAPRPWGPGHSSSPPPSGG